MVVMKRVMREYASTSACNTFFVQSPAQCTKNCVVGVGILKPLHQDPTGTGISQYIVYTQIFTSELVMRSVAGFVVRRTCARDASWSGPALRVCDTQPLARLFDQMLLLRTVFGA